METLKYIHKNKTGKLLKLPIEIGCVIGDASKEIREKLEEYADLIGLAFQKEIREKLEEYADLIGLAFQIKDDILDVEGDFEKLGKPVGSDAELEKSTYPSLIGMEESKKLLDETLEKAKKIIADNFSEEKGKILIELADFIGDETLEKAKKIIADNFSEEKGKILIELADFIGKRDN